MPNQQNKEALPMLPDKNELNDEMTDQINGGLEDVGLIKPGTIDCSSDDSSKTARTPNYYRCPNCARTYRAYEERTDGRCPNCEPKPLEVSIPTDNMQTTIPSNNKNAFKTH